MTEMKTGTQSIEALKCPACGTPVQAIHLADIKGLTPSPSICSFLPDGRVCCSHLKAYAPLATSGEAPHPMGLAQDSQGRKDQPLARGLLDYFPDALSEVSELSRLGNEKHNPGQGMHWARSKSGDEADCIVRHLIERGGFIEGEYSKPVRHSAALAWRALALLQKEIEVDRGDGQISRGSKT